MLKTFYSIIIWPVWYAFFVPSLFFLLFVIMIFPRQYFFYIIRPICWVYCFLAGQWLRKENEPPSKHNGPYLYMFNHVSMFDQFMIGAYIPHYITAVAAIEVFKYPIWGYIIKKYGVIPIVRQKIRKAIGSLKLAEEAIKKGTSFLISPEGTRTITGEIGPFKKGPFHLAKNTKVTIVPIGLIGGFKAKKKNDWRISPGVLTVVFGKPIESNEYQDLNINELRDLVLNKIITLKENRGNK